MTRTRRWYGLFLLCFVPSQASAQIVEAVGNRALGMGGAFVAVANDSSATWWNPAGLAPGPFLDLAFGWASTDIGDQETAHRERAGWMAVGTPPLGFSFYHVKTTDIGAFRPIGPDAAGREDGGAAVPEAWLSLGQLGATLVHTVVSGVHAGTTLKYVRAKDLGGEFDLDIGVLAVRGPIRLGGVVRNVRQATIETVTLPRQARVGAAVETDVRAIPLTVAVDADVRTYATSVGDRRAVAVGGEGWTPGRRLGFRAGARFNTVGAEERALTAGVSVAVRSGAYVEAFMVRGGSLDERGWGIAARASF